METENQRRMGAEMIKVARIIWSETACEARVHFAPEFESAAEIIKLDALQDAIAELSKKRDSIASDFVGGKPKQRKNYPVLRLPRPRAVDMGFFLFNPRLDRIRAPG
jgi:hypothetical protein